MGENNHHAFQIPGFQPVEYLPCLVAVADVLERFGGVLAADVEENFFAASMVA